MASNARPTRLNPLHPLQKQLMRELSVLRASTSPYIVQYYGTFFDEVCVAAWLFFSRFGAVALTVDHVARRVN